MNLKLHQDECFEGCASFGVSESLLDDQIHHLPGLSLGCHDQTCCSESDSVYSILSPAIKKSWEVKKVIGKLMILH